MKKKVAIKSELSKTNKENKDELLGSYEALSFNIKLYDAKNDKLWKDRRVFPDTSAANVLNVLNTLQKMTKKETEEIEGIDKNTAIKLFFKDKEDIKFVKLADYRLLTDMFVEIYKHLKLFDQTAINELTEQVRKQEKAEKK